MKTLLVTGGCGFIGSNFIRHFLKSYNNWKIIIFDKLTYLGNRENTRELEGNSRYEFMKGDVCDAGLVYAAVERADAVIHFAAETHVDRSIISANDFVTTNVLGSWNLLEAARKYGVKRFLHISTDEVYGSLTKGSASEDAPLLPNSPYAASKAAADLFVRSYWKTHQYQVIIVRSTNNFGPYQYPEKVIPLFVTNLLQNKKVPLYGTGENRREWIYVEDNCAAVELILDKGREGEIYNVGTGREMSNLELARAIFKMMNIGDDMIEYVPDRLGHDFRYSVDTTKIGQLGFKPKWTFEQALKKTVEWYTRQREWWQPLKRDVPAVQTRV